MTIKFHPYWWDIPDKLTIEQNADLPAEADVVIVGGGFTGLAAGLTMARAGKSVVIIEKNTPGYGASTRNGGICSGSIRPTHSTLMRRYGQQFADEVYREAVEARIDLTEFCDAEGIDCEFRMSGWFKGALSPRDYDKMASQAERLASSFGVPCYMVSRREQYKEINTDRFFGGMVENDIGGFHPAKFFAGLLKVVDAAGVLVFNQTEVLSIEDAANNTKVITSDKGAIRSPIVIIATNGYNTKKRPFNAFVRRVIIPVQSSIIVTEELGEDKIRTLMPAMRMYGNSAKLLTYFRPTPDGNRILLGARGAESDPTMRTVRYLRNRLINMFPDLADVKIDYCWTGNVAFNRQMIPRIFSHKGIHYASGYGGSGTVWARWCGKKVAEQALGTANKASVFTGPPPASVPLYDGHPWFMPIINGYYYVCDVLNQWRRG